MLAQSTETLPVIVDRVEVVGCEDGACQVLVTVRNTGSRTVIAWGIRTTANLPDGTSVKSTTFTDSYDAAARPSGVSRILVPNGTSRIRSGLSPAQVSKAVGTPSSQAIVAVFDDDKAIGDESLVERIFERRLLNQRAWQVIEETLVNARARALDAGQAIQSADAELAAIRDEDIRNSAPYAEIRRSLSGQDSSIAKRIDPRSKGTPEEQLLKDLLENVRLRRQIAEARSRRQR
jgi:hypothetical protein